MRAVFRYFHMILFVGSFCFINMVNGESFVIGELMGQLGNQCFQVATTLSLAWDNNAVPLFPDFKTKTQWKIPLNYEKVFWRLDILHPSGETKFDYYEPCYPFVPIPYHPNMKIIGYFQSEKYFRKYKERIIALFAPSWEIMDYLTNKYSKIIKHPNSVSIHIRDYYQECRSIEYHPVIGREYLQKAISLFSKDALFVFFSDNIDWCKTQFNELAENMIFMEGEAHYHDFYLMSLCKHNIISNSSFSWWAAYLNQNPDKVVVAPNKWFQESTGINTKDLIPEDWIILP